MPSPRRTTSILLAATTETSTRTIVTSATRAPPVWRKKNVEEKWRASGAVEIEGRGSTRLLGWRRKVPKEVMRMAEVPLTYYPGALRDVRSCTPWPSLGLAAPHTPLLSQRSFLAFCRRKTIGGYRCALTKKRVGNSTPFSWLTGHIPLSSGVLLRVKPAQGL